MDVPAFLTDLGRLPWYRGQIVHRQEIPAREAVPGNLDQPLNPDLQGSLESQHIEFLYSHQAEAINALNRGENVIVATPAASGKSLCYHLPVLESLLEDRTSRALYIYPTKALAQNQSKALSALVPDARRLRHGIFDGDTPSQDRPDVRRHSQILITNPDMLHLGILPNHRAWYQLLRGLRYVVIDEAHVYRGVFGSHVANVIRRLRRLCRHFGGDPQFVLCSATIANPGEHAEQLVGLPFNVIDKDGSPYGGKDFALWNPPMIDMAQGSRRSTNSESALLSAELLRRRVRTMTFVRSRRMAELLHIYVRDQLKATDPAIAKRVAPYRASYMPEDRRRIERDLFEGRLLGLTTTSAMELGVDIGGLGRDGADRIPGQHCQHLAAGRAQRQERGALPQHTGGAGQPTGPVHDAASGGALRQASRERAHLGNQPLHPETAPLVCGLRSSIGLKGYRVLRTGIGRAGR